MSVGGDNTPATSSEDEGISPADAAHLRDAKISLIALLGFLTLLGSLAPWIMARAFKQRALDAMNVLSAMAAGVILGAFLCHMVPDVSATFSEYLTAQYGAEDKRTTYPWGMMIAGAVFVLLVTVDRLVLHAHMAGENDHHGHSHGGHSHAGPASPRSGGHDHISESIAALQAVKEQEAADADMRSARKPVAASGAAMGSSEIAPVPDTAAVTSEQHEHHDRELGTDTTGATLSVHVPEDVEAAVSVTQGLTGTKGRVDASAGVRALVFILALSLHAVFDGLALGAETNINGFYSILIAVLAHKVFDGIAAGAAVYPARLSFPVSLFLITLCAFMTPLGIAIGYGATAAVQGDSAELASAIIVSMSAGSFLFISLAELLPSSLHDGRWMHGKLFAFFLGWAALIILAAFV